MSACGQARLDLEMRPASGRQRALGCDTAACDEDGSDMAGLCRRYEQTPAHRAQSFEPLQLVADALERLQPVAQPGSVLEAARVGELRQPPPQPWERKRGPLEFVRTERTRRELRAAARANRADRGLLRRCDNRVAAPPEPDVPVGARDARVRRWPQLADETQLEERRLELRADDMPFDPLDRAERGLHLRPLA